MVAVRFLCAAALLLSLPAGAQRSLPRGQPSSTGGSGQFTEFFLNGGANPRIPFDPRTFINLEEVKRTPVKITVGVQTKILGVVDTELKTEVTYNREYQVNTWIFVQGEDADVIRKDPGSDTFSFDPGTRRAVRVCAVSGALKLSEEHLGKVFIGAAGTSVSRIYDGTEEVRQTSEIVEIKPGETPEQHRRACRRFADEKYPQVLQSLNALAASRIYWDELSQCNPSEGVYGNPVCKTWHRTLLPSVEAWTTPVCVKKAHHASYFCSIKSIRGGNCSYKDDKGHWQTSGMFEYPCAAGLVCRLTKKKTFFSYGKAECVPDTREDGRERNLTQGPSTRVH